MLWDNLISITAFPLENLGMARECFWFILCDAVFHSSVLAKSSIDQRICFELFRSPWKIDCRRFCADNEISNIYMHRSVYVHVVK